MRVRHCPQDAVFRAPRNHTSPEDILIGGMGTSALAARQESEPGAAGWLREAAFVSLLNISPSLPPFVSPIPHCFATQQAGPLEFGLCG